MPRPLKTICKRWERSAVTSHKRFRVWDVTALRFHGLCEACRKIADCYKREESRQVGGAAPPNRYAQEARWFVRG